MEQIDTPKITASDICDVLGRRAIADKIGVGMSAVSNASVDGRFPAKWFRAIQSMCSDAGIECPDRLFNFIGVAIPADTEDRKVG